MEYAISGPDIDQVHLLSLGLWQVSVYSCSKAKEQHVILIFNFISMCKKNKLADRFVQKTFSMNNRLL